MIIFFIHRFNDVDHFTPEIYKIVSTTDQKVAVLCLNPNYDISGDFRLRFLKDNYKVLIDYIYNVHKPTIFYKIMGFLMRSSRRSFATHKISDLLTRSGPKIIFHSVMARLKLLDRTINRIYDERWIQGLLDHYSPEILVFDYAATQRLYNVKSIIKKARRKSIPILYLPHGIPLFIKHSKDYDRSKQDLTDIVKYQCDSMVFYHRWWLDECIAFGLNEQKTETLGIPRHCREWQQILHRILPMNESLKEKGTGKLKIVYMDSGPDRYHEHKSEAEKTIEMISNLDFVSFIYKPHTRRNVVNLNIPSNVDIIKDINSVNLIKWADVVIGMHSSIMIEVLIQGKVYISPTYFRSRKLIFEEYGACCSVDSIDELKSALLKLDKDATHTFYPKESVERFLRDVVYNGTKDGDVLGDYKNYILKMIKGEAHANG